MEFKYLNNNLTRPDEHWASFQILDTVFMWVSCVGFERLINVWPRTKIEINGGISKKQKEKSTQVFVLVILNMKWFSDYIKLFWWEGSKHFESIRSQSKSCMIVRQCMLLVNIFFFSFSSPENSGFPSKS